MNSNAYFVNRWCNRFAKVKWEVLDKWNDFLK